MYSCNEFYVRNYQSFSFVILSILQCIKLAVLSKIKSHSDAVNYFKELPYYNKPIGNPKVKHLKNLHQLAELPFYEELSVIKTNQLFRGYAMSYKVEIIEKKDPFVQLEGSIKDLFGDLLNATEDFKYQITVKVLFKKIQAQWRN